jgi:hypothetical protein
MRLRVVVLWAIAGGVVLAGIGCDQIRNKDRYELKQDNSGRTVRLDKQTGEIAVLQGDALKPVLSAVDQKAADERRQLEESAQRAKVAQLGVPKVYPSQEFAQIGVKAATVYTMWRDGKLYFQLQMTPTPPKLFPTWGFGLSRFRIAFRDANGFQLISEPIPTADLMNITDNNGNSGGMYANWSIPLSQEIYVSIAAWTISWAN